MIPPLMAEMGIIPPLSIWPSCDWQSLSRQAASLSWESPKKLKIVVGAAVAPPVAAPATPVAPPAPAPARGEAAAGGIGSAPGGWALDSGANRATPNTPPTHFALGVMIRTLPR